MSLANIVRNLPQVAGAQPQVIQLIDFRGGLNLQRDALLLADNESGDMCNVDPMESGGVCRRDAVTAVAQDLPDNVCSLSFFETVEGESYIIAGLADGTVWTVRNPDANGAGYLTQAPVPPSPSCWQHIQISGKSYYYDGESNSYCVDENGVATELSWTVVDDFDSDFQNPFNAPAAGVAATDTGFPIADCMQVWANRVWAAGVVDPVTGEKNCNRVAWSFPLTNDDPSGAEDWFESGWVDVDEGRDGDCITAMVPCGDRMLVFKSHSTYMLALDGEAALPVPLCQDIGAVSKKAVTCCNCKLYFWDARRGLHSFANDEVRWEFAKLYPLIEEGIVDCNRLDEVSIGCCGTRVFVSLPITGGTCATYVLDTAIGQQGAWTKYDLELECFLDYCPKDGKGFTAASTKKCNHLVALCQDGKVDDFGCSREEIEGRFCTKWLDGGNPYVTKRWCRPRVVAVAGESASVNIDLRADYLEASVASDVLDLSSVPAEPFVLGAGEPCTHLKGAAFERLRPGGPLVERKCGTCSSGQLKGDGGQKTKECGPKVECRSCTMQFCFTGTDCWCICSVLAIYYEGRLNCG